LINTNKQKKATQKSSCF